MIQQSVGYGFGIGLCSSPYPLCTILRLVDIPAHRCGPGDGRLTGPRRYSRIITYTRMGTCFCLTNSIYAFSRGQVPPIGRQAGRHASGGMMQAA